MNTFMLMLFMYIMPGVTFLAGYTAGALRPRLLPTPRTHRIGWQIILGWPWYLYKILND